MGAIKINLENSLESKIDHNIEILEVILDILEITKYSCAKILVRNCMMSFTQFSQRGLLPDVDTFEHKPGVLALNLDRIRFMGTTQTDNLVANDIKGARISEEITKIAREKELPIGHETDGGHHIKVTTHEIKPEKSPEILLEALAEYAKTKFEPNLAKLAMKAAAKVHVMTLTVKSDKAR